MADFSSEKVLVRVVDDEGSIRESLAYMLGKAGFECKTYASAKDFLISDSPSVKGCLILDVRIPEMSGLELQNEMNRRGIKLPVIFFSGHGDLDMAVETMRKGAATFLQKTVTSEKLLAAVAEAVEASLANEARRLTDADVITRWNVLSKHEQAIALLMGEGKLTSDIAKTLGVSPKTVYNYRTEVCRKLSASTPADVSRFVFRVRQINPDV